MAVSPSELESFSFPEMYRWLHRSRSSVHRRRGRAFCCCRRTGAGCAFTHCLASGTAERPGARPMHKNNVITTSRVTRGHLTSAVHLTLIMLFIRAPVSGQIEMNIRRGQTDKCEHLSPEKKIAYSRFPARPHSIASPAEAIFMAHKLRRVRLDENKLGKGKQKLIQSADRNRFSALSGSGGEEQENKIIFNESGKCRYKKNRKAILGG